MVVVAAWLPTPSSGRFLAGGGVIGAASAVLTHQLRHQPTPAGQANGFGTTFVWVLAIAVAAAVPTILLARIEHHGRRRANASTIEEAADVGH